MAIRKLIHAFRPDFMKGCVFLKIPNLPTLVVFLMIHDNLLIAFGDDSFEFLTYQLSMLGCWPTMAVSGNRELGFDSGEGVLRNCYLLPRKATSAQITKS